VGQDQLAPQVLLVLLDLLVPPEVVLLVLLDLLVQPDLVVDQLVPLVLLDY
jgi:hypothetical protein